MGAGGAGAEVKQEVGAKVKEEEGDQELGSVGSVVDIGAAPRTRVPLIVAPGFQRREGPPIALLILLDDHGVVTCALEGYGGLEYQRRIEPRSAGPLTPATSSFPLGLPPPSPPFPVFLSFPEGVSLEHEQL